MTEEQVARLEGFCDENYACSEPRDLRSALERALEERKRLLVALKDAERCGVTSQTEDRIQAAIAYAEEEAA